MKKLLASILLTTAMNAWSDNPIPSGRDQATGQQKPSEQITTKSKSDQNLSPPRASSIANNIPIKVIDIPHSKEESAKDKDQNGYKSVFGWPLEYANAIFTFALAIIGAATGGVLCWQACLLRKQIKLGREEFIASHRPKIIARSFQIVDRDLPVGKKANFIFVAQNVGDTTAKIINLFSGTFVQSAKISTIPGDLTFPHRENLIPNFLLKSGQNELFPGNGGSEIEGDESMNIYAGEMAFYCMGIITYDDAIGTRRETGFCRRYHPRENRWEVVDSEYEYAY